MSRRSVRILAYTLLGGLGLGLGLGGCRSAPAARPTGTLLLSVTPAGATLLLDDRPLPARSGEALLRVAMAPGPHRLELRAPGYFTAYRDVSVVAATEQRLSVALRPDPDAAPIGTTPARPLGEMPPLSGELP